MLSSTFAFSLLLSTVLAQPFKSGSRISTSCTESSSPTVVNTSAKPTLATVPADSTLPSFVFFTSGATITPPTTSAPVAASTSLPVDDDQPAPHKSIPIPALESFNPKLAPAFTKVPSIGPVYPSTPCSSEVLPSKTPDSQSTAASPVTPVPEASKVPATSAPRPEGTSTSIKAPPSEGEPEISSTTALPIKTSTPASTSRTEIHIQTTGTPLGAERPQPTETGAPASRPSPTGSGWFHGAHPTDRFGWGRPRPSGMWPGQYRPKPTGRPHYPHRPSAAAVAPVMDKPISTPCTLETRVGPTATGAR